jgi:D-alanyl-lipoteichoic acid acyltransferase DltB (MBOAT superfamily)
MTLTRWLRLYIFTPLTRALLRGERGWDLTAAAVAQVVTMTACGLWHGLRWNFALWGFLQAVGLVWVAIGAREIARALPPPVVAWWRRSPLAHGLSVALTFNAFALGIVFVLVDVPSGLGYLGRLVLGPP